MRKLLAFPMAAALAAALLLSCASAETRPAPPPEELVEAAGAIADAAGAGGSAFAQRGILSLLEFAGERLGPEAAAEIARARTPDQLQALLSSRYSTTAYEQALEAFMAWDRGSKAPRWNPKKAERLETEHFALVTMPGTPAYADREELAALLEGELSAIAAIVKPDAATLRRFEANLASLASKKVEVVLPPDSRAFPGFGDTATTNWGFALGEGGKLGIVASIDMPYYGPLSSAILAHEATHVLDIFYKLDLEAAPPLPSRDGDLSKLPKKELEAFTGELKAWAGGVFQAILPNDTAFGEGFAEYVAGKVSPLRRALIGSPNAALIAMSTRTPLLNEVLAGSPSVKDRKVRIVRYTELHSLVEYLVESYGMESFLSFYLAPPIVEPSFARVYGKSYKEMEAEWLAARGF